MRNGATCRVARSPRSNPGGKFFPLSSTNRLFGAFGHVVGDERTTRALKALAEVDDWTDVEEADIVIHDAIASANALESRARDLHRALDTAIDNDLSAVASITRELRETYFARDQVRDALAALRQRAPHLFDRAPKHIS